HSVFVNVFGGVTACDQVANGLVQALNILGDSATQPLGVRLDGNKVDEGRAILAEANHPLVTIAATKDEDADKAAQLANKEGRDTQECRCSSIKIQRSSSRVLPVAKGPSTPL